MSQSQNQKPSEMDRVDLPDVRAFQDEFTRDFLQSKEETRDGYYPFLSGTGKYKMDFPADGEIGERSYFVRETDHEEIMIGVKDVTGSRIRIIYNSNRKPEQLTEDLNRFKKRIGYEGDFKELEQDSQSLYYTTLKNNGFRDYAGYILHEKGMGGVEVVYEIDCKDEKEQICAENKQQLEERAMKLLKSIQFLNEDGSE